MSIDQEAWTYTHWQLEHLHPTSVWAIAGGGSDLGLVKEEAKRRASQGQTVRIVQIVETQTVMEVIKAVDDGG